MKIRFVQKSDERQVKRMILRYLKDTFVQGGDFPATLENAQAFFDYAVEGAECGDPCLVAVDDVNLEAHPKDGLTPQIIAFVMARGVLFPGMTTRDVTLRSWGTYVDPAYRGQRAAIKLFMVMGRVAKNKGYTRVLGATHGSGYEDNAMKVIKSLVGMKEVGKLLVWQLSAPTVGESHAPTHNVPAGALASA